MNKYIRKETKGQILALVIILLAIIAGLVWNYIEEQSSASKWEPTENYPMANISISWLQTYHPGGWNNAGT